MNSHLTSPADYPFVDNTSTTINPVFKFNSSLNTSTLPTSEFDTRNFQDMVYYSGRNISDSLLYSHPYSTQSLDRKKMMKIRSANSLKEEVILRPLNHLPFDYLNRPGNFMNIRDASLDGHYYHSKTLPRDFGDKNSSTHSIRDVAL